MRLTRADRTCLSSKDMQPGNTYKIYVNLQNLKVGHDFCHKHTLVSRSTRRQNSKCII